MFSILLSSTHCFILLNVATKAISGPCSYNATRNLNFPLLLLAAWCARWSARWCASWSARLWAWTARLWAYWTARWGARTTRWGARTARRSAWTASSSVSWTTWVATIVVKATATACDAEHTYSKKSKCKHF